MAETLEEECGKAGKICNNFGESLSLCCQHEEKNGKNSFPSFYCILDMKKNESMWNEEKKNRNMSFYYFCMKEKQERKARGKKFTMILPPT